MKDPIQRVLKNRKGFTLVELLMVIAVLGIISAIAIPRFTGILGGIRENADLRTAEIFAKEIETKLMVGDLSMGTHTTLTITANAPDDPTGTGGYTGVVPKSQVDKNTYFTAVITKSSSGYTISVYTTDADQPLVNEKSVIGPVQ